MLFDIKNCSFLFIISADWSSVAFSPDCTRLAVGSYLHSASTVSLLDIQVNEPSSPSSNQQLEESSGVTALTLSWNCSRVACGFEDGAVELWETAGFPRRIAAHRHHKRHINLNTLGFSPDSRQFASGSDDGTIILWDGEDGEQRADLQYSAEEFCVQLRGVEISNNVLAAVGSYGISLWDCKKLDRIQNFDGDFGPPLSFSADGALLAAVPVQSWCNSSSITVFDVTTHTAIATFDTGWNVVHTMAFLPDNSQLVASGNPYDSELEFLTFNLISKKTIRGPSFENFIQLPDMPLWHGVPVWVNKEGELYYLEALFSQHDDPVPVLWIPWEIDAQKRVQRRSMIAIRCKESVVLLQLPTTATATATETRATSYDGNLSYGWPGQQTAAALPYGQNTHVPTALVRNRLQEDASGFTSDEFERGSQ